MRSMLSALLAASLLVTPALASGPRGTTTGVANPPVPSSNRAAASAPAFTYTNAAYSSGGVGLRNRLAGGIEISAVNPPIQAAFLYWAVITNGALPSAAKTPTLTRRAPTTSSATTLSGTVIATGSSPCWGGSGISVLRATVPTSVASGTGLYEVRFPAGAGGASDGRDPWEGSVLYPLLEGASLVIVGRGSGSRVAIYDRGHAGTTFSSTYTYSLALPIATSSANVTLGFIGADGQHGNSRIPETSIGTERTSVNGIAVAGPGSTYVDSIWNGSAGLPIAQLWDDSSHVVQALPLGTQTLNVTTTPTNDCLTPVATIARVR